MKGGRWLKGLRLKEAEQFKDLDARSTTLWHAGLIQQKTFLRKFHEEIYRKFRKVISVYGQDAKIVELGSGGGFIKEILPHAVTSDITTLPNVDKQFSVLKMPFEDEGVDVFLMIDVFHHVTDAHRFLTEMNRCLRPTGRIIMVEPANTLWSRFILMNFHHEPFDPSAGWAFNGTGRLSSANQALPWIVFCRDREKFLQEFPALKIKQVATHTPFRYLISGGVSMKQLLPSWCYGTVKTLEAFLTPWNDFLGMFMTVELQKQ